MVVRKRKISDLKPAAYNPRYITEKQEEELRDSLKEFGQVRNIIINVNPSRKDIIIGGHQTTRIWGELGNEYIHCLELDLSEEKERELNIRLNKNGGEFDISVLKKEFELDNLREWGFMDFELGIDDFVLEDERGDYREETIGADDYQEGEEESITVTIGESEELIYIGLDISTERSLGWEEIQAIKDKYYPSIGFIEVYPKRGEIINKANNRHLFHIRGGQIPHLSIIEQDMDIKHFEI